MHSQTKLADFSGQVLYIGLDTHKQNWKVSIRTRDLHLKTFSMDPSPEQLYKYMNTHYPNARYKSVYEAGFCGYWIHRQLLSYNFENIIVNPADVPSTNKERDRKSDPIDSAKLSRERANDSLTGIFVPDTQHEALRCLHRLYEQNTKRITQMKNRIKGYLHFTGIKIPREYDKPYWSKNFLGFLASIKFLETISKTVMESYLNDLCIARTTRNTLLREIRKASKSIPVIQLLSTAPGISLTTAFTLYVELVDIKRFKTFDQLASYVGLVPSTYSSDTTVVVGGVTMRHCSHLRSILIECAWIAIRNDPALLSAYNELTKHMRKTAAIIRIAKKLLNRIRFVWQNQTAYVKGIVAVEARSKV
jgi:transposase